MSRFLFLGVFGCYLAAGQTTKVDLQNQTRGVDFSAATSTKPAKTGTALPSVCSTGEAYVLTTAVAGSNLYICTAQNTWSVQSGQPGLTGPAGRKAPLVRPARWSYRAARCCWPHWGCRTAGFPGSPGSRRRKSNDDAGRIRRAVGNCTAPSTSNLGLYTDSANGDIYVCAATNTWKRIFTGAAGDAVEVTGAVQSALATPASGSVSCYFDNAALTWQCKNAAGAVYTSVKVVAGRTTNQFMTHIGTDGVQVTAQPTDTDLHMTAASSANDVSTTTHGFVPIAPNDNTKALCGDGAWGTTCGGSGTPATDATISISDVTTNNVSTTKHGWTPKLLNDSTKYLNSAGAWTVPPAGTGGGYDPTDLSQKIIRETWCSAFNDKASVGLGSMRWFLISGGGTPTYAAVAPCGITMSTAGGATDNAITYLSQGPIRVVPGTSADWTVTWKLSLSTLTNVTYYIGMNNNAASGGYCPMGAANCMAWVFNSTVSGSESRFVACDASFACSTTTSTVTPVAGTTFTFTIKSTSSAITAFVNNETPLTISFGSSGN